METKTDRPAMPTIERLATFIEQSGRVIAHEDAQMTSA
jgi:hypothetical protein